MEDSAIVSLFWQRSPEAIPEAQRRYGSYCAQVAANILGSPEDTEECVNDALLAAWNAIPPHRPALLRTFLGKLTRNLALNRREKALAGKRGGGQVPLILEELREVVSGRSSVEDALAQKELTRAIDSWLDSLEERKRNLFVRRYWYCDSLEDLAARTGKRPNTIAVTLHRLREDLRRHLTERGFEP